MHNIVQNKYLVLNNKKNYASPQIFVVLLLADFYYNIIFLDGPCVSELPFK